MRRIIIGVLGICLSATICLGGGWTSWTMFSEADFRPQIGQNDLRVIIAALQLSEDERIMVQDLHTAHIGRVRDEGAQVKADCVDLIERTQLLGDGSHMKEVMAKREEWTKRREALDKEFLADLRLVLSAEQDARWSIVERELRRMRGMPSGRMVGESVDAIAMVTDAEIDQTPEISAILDRYAREVDAALRARDGALDDVKDANLSSLVETDPEQARKLFERVRAERIRIRDLNRRAIEEVAARLTPEDGARLRSRFTTTIADPLDLTDSYAMQVLTAAADMDSATESQRARITAATDAYLAKRDRWIEDYIATAMKVEETSIPEQLERALQGLPLDTSGRGLTETKSERARVDALRRAWEDRVDLEKRARTEAYALLTPEQRVGMPLLIEQARIRFGDLYGTYDYLSP